MSIFVTQSVGRASCPILFENVLSHGAVGNGVNDDTAAIESAIAVAGATGGVVFPPVPVCYRLTRALTPQHSVFLLGLGATKDAGPELFQATITEPVFEVSAQTTLNPVITNFRMRGGSHGIRISTEVGVNTQFDRLDVSNYTDAGLYLNAPAAHLCVTDSRFGGGDYGFLKDADARLADSLLFTRCNFDAADVAGFYTQKDAANMSSIILVECVMEGNNGPAIYIDSDQVVLVNPYFEFNSVVTGDADIFMDETTVGNPPPTLTMHGGQLGARSEPQQQLPSGKYRRIQLNTASCELYGFGTVYSLPVTDVTYHAVGATINFTPVALLEAI